MNVVLCFLVVLNYCVLTKTVNYSAKNTQTEDSTTSYQETYTNELVSNDFTSVTTEYTSSINEDTQSSANTITSDLNSSIDDQSSSGTVTKETVSSVTVTEEILYSATVIGETLSSVTATEETLYSSTTSTSQSDLPSSTKESCPETPAEIRNLAIRKNSFKVILQWDPPENDNCVQTYTVYMNKNEYTNTSNTTLEIPNLSACTNYEVSIAVFDGTDFGNEVGKKFKTPVPQPFSLAVEKLNAKPINEKLRINWKAPPKNVLSCISGYTVISKNFENDTTRTTFELPGTLVGCMDYKIEVYPKSGRLHGTSSTITYHHKGFPTKAPEIISVTPSKTSVDLKLKVEKKSPSNCKLTKIIIRCITSGKTVRKELSVKTQSNTFDMSILNLSPYTNYTCQTFAKNSIGNSSVHKFNFSTTEEVPSAPEDVEVVETGSHYFTVKWTKPTYVPGVLRYYGLLIIDEGLAPSGEECISGHTTTFHTNTTDNFYNFTKAMPFHNYTVYVHGTDGAGDGANATIAVTTEEDVPGKPKSVKVTKTDSHHFIVEWTKPCYIPGILTSYGLRVYHKGANYFLNEGCFDTHQNTTELVKIDDILHNVFVVKNVLSYYNYTVSVFGITGAGDGSEATAQVTTQSSKPEDVTNAQLLPPVYSDNETYLAVTTLRFDPPCKYNGPFKFYRIVIIGRRNGFKEDIQTIEIKENTINLNMQPERNYLVTVAVVTEGYHSSVPLPQIQTKPGVPVVGFLQAPLSNESTRAYFRLSDDSFSNINGEILYYALILLPESNLIQKTYGFWDNNNETWPKVHNGSGKGFVPYQLTPNLWNPFRNNEKAIDFIIGEEENCRKNPCNRPLEADKDYFLIVRAFTSAAYKDSAPMHFKTEKESRAGLITGLIFGFLSVIGLTVFFLWKYKQRNLKNGTDNTCSTHLPPSISCVKFVDYYKTIKENNEILKNQYSSLSAQSKEMVVTTTYAILPENKRKNRYTNILPYDETRVKLKIDEDDEISSDYINASFIKGYSGKIEYIATQGPLESTCKDFWKMVLQENVSIIVMVTQFIEQSKEKCFQYIPNNHEKISFGESLDVRCSTELHFGTYCVRTLQVRKDNEQRNVIHMQFLEWPDFGVPSNTDNIIELCHQMREKVSVEGGLIVVHCSAGVGRTGTLIALDIILQAIEHNKDINVYQTVLELRKQRTHMVQTEKQYVFIHTCIKDYLESPTIQSNEQQQNHIYENMDIIQSSLKKNLIETELESAL